MITPFIVSWLVVPKAFIELNAVPHCMCWKQVIVLQPGMRYYRPFFCKPCTMQGHQACVWNEISKLFHFTHRLALQHRLCSRLCMTCTCLSMIILLSTQQQQDFKACCFNVTVTIIYSLEVPLVVYSSKISFGGWVLNPLQPPLYSCLPTAWSKPQWKLFLFLFSR